jgi:hypothetical protein
MVSTVLPLYLVVYLGLTPLQFGLVDGLYQGVTALVRLIGGAAADRSRRHKEIAAVGYGLSAVCKIGLSVASAWPTLAGVLAVDRMGKGMRTAPRDALISLTTSPANLGIAFGVHRAFDSTGALLGPLVALAILALQPDRFDVVFIASFSFAVVGLAVLLLFVENPQVDACDRQHGDPTEPALSKVISARGLVGLTVAAGLLSLATVSDAFIYLLLQRHAQFDAALFPLLYVGTASSFLLFAIPLGRISDRVGRDITLLAGYALLPPIYLMAAQSQITGPTIVACLVLLGCYYAMTDGVLMALASESCRPERRASGLAIVTTVTSGARLVAPVLFGALWTRYDASMAAHAFAGALLVAWLCAAVILRLTGKGVRADASIR